MTPAIFMSLWFVLEPWKRRLDLFRTLWLLHVLAALAYWIGVDLPRARDLDRHWPAARSLAGQIATDRDQVVIDASLADLGILLELQLDRRVKEHAERPDMPIPASTQWLIIPGNAQPPQGFVPWSNVGECRLLHRG